MLILLSPHAVIKSLFLCCIFLFSTKALHAQFLSFQMGINGLTCSQCSRSVEMSLRKLSFVKDVQMNLKNTECIITPVKQQKTVPAEIARAVRDAGFSVRYLNATFNFEAVSTISPEGIFVWEGKKYSILNYKEDAKPSQEGKIQFIGKEFLSNKDYQQMKPQLRFKNVSEGYNIKL